MSLNDINPVEIADDENQTEVLPLNWQQTTLGEICPRIVDGSHNPPKAQLDGLPMLSAKNIKGRRITFDDPRLISHEDFASENLRTSVSPNDVLMTIVGAIGRTAVVTEGYKPFALQRSVAVLKKPYTNSKLLAYFLESPELQKYFSENAKGTAQKGIYLKALSQTPLPLPPLAEQVRIADKLDALLARVEAGRERLERVPKLLKRFRQSVLSAAVSGELTREWREEEDASWTAPAPLSQFTELDVGYAFKSADFSTSGVRLLRGDNIEPGRLRWREAKCMPPEKLKDFEGYTIRPGDVILAMDRPIISSGLKIARATEQDVPSMLVQRVCRFKPKPDLDPGFLFVLLRSHNFITYLGDKQNGTQVPHISAKQILGFAVSVPDLNEQAEIVRRVEALLAIADRIEAKYAAALSSFDRLTPALLAKAFRGELVPQDPDDEPAYLLLERVKAEHAHSLSDGKKKRQKLSNKDKQINSENKISVPYKTDESGMVTDFDSEKGGVPLDALIRCLISQNGVLKPAQLLSMLKLEEDIELFFEMIRSAVNKKIINCSEQVGGDIVLLNKEDYKLL